MSKLFKSIAKAFSIAISVAIPGIGTAIGAAIFTAIGVTERLQARKEAKRAAEAAQGINDMVRNSIMPRREIYGRRRVGGLWAYAETSSDKKYLYLVLILGEGPVAGVDEIFFGNEIVPLDGSGNATGKYAGAVRIKKYTGAAGQTADPEFSSELSRWTADHKLLGVAYLAVRLTWNTKLFGQTGIPNVSAVVRGRNDIFDPRTSTTGYTTNSALILAHYLELPNLGPNVDRATEIDSADLQASANACEETVALAAAGDFAVNTASDGQLITSAGHGLHDAQIVVFSSTGTLPTGVSAGTDYFVRDAANDSFKISATLDGAALTMTADGSGTHSFTAKEYRYTFNAVVSTDQDPEENIQLIQTSMAGNAVYSSGKWSIFAGVYDVPAYTLAKEHLRNGVTFTPKRSKRDRLNTVKGVWVGARNRWNPTDYPVVSNSTYVTEDAEELIFSLDLPATNSPQMAQRIAKVHLEKSRAERAVSIECSLEALRLRAGRTCLVNLPRYGLASIPFEVNHWSFSVKGEVILVALKLSEIASTVFDWDSSEEGVINQAEAPALADFNDIDPPTGLASANGSGRNLVSVVLTWDATTDQSVLEGGFVRVQFKKNADFVWTEVGIVDGNATRFEVTDLEPNAGYDFRVSFKGVAGGESDPAELINHITAPSTSSDSGFNFSQPVPSTTWSITHNLGYQPSVVVFDDGGIQVDPLILSSTPFVLILKFTSAISGTAHLS